jgi:hypothetical protein
MKCPVCWKSVILSNRGVVMRHREGCGRNCPMSGHEHPNAYENQVAA